MTYVLFVHPKVIAVVDPEGVVLPERPGVCQHVNPLPGRQLALKRAGVGRERADREDRSG